MITPVLSQERYAVERDMCEGGTKRRRYYLTAEEAAHPDYAACDNAMRGRVEQYEILTGRPERFVAYMGQPDRRACNYESAQPWPVTTFAGNRLGYAQMVSSWRVRSYVGSTMYQFRARIAEREYTGRGFGEGMSIVFRETAASKRKRVAWADLPESTRAAILSYFEE